MVKKRKTRKQKDEFGADQDDDKPTKEEYAVAKWMRKNVQIKKTKFLNHHVEYFTGSKAVEALLTTKWATGDAPLFADRADVVEFLNDMLLHKFFHRAKKVPVSEEELRKSKKEGKCCGDSTTAESKKDSKAAKEKESKDLKEKESKEKELKDKEAKEKDLKDKEAKEKDLKEKESKEKDSKELTPKESKDGDKSATSACEGKDSKDKEKEKERKRRKIRLEMHAEQWFVDGADAYVWIYDPIPAHYWLAGLAVLLGAIGVCMFPLWPPTVRKGVYYLSIAAAGFLTMVLALAVVRLIVFCAVWMITLSRHHVWLLPNLTQDVGFFASFWPLYEYEYHGPGSGNETTGKGKKKRKKEKVSDDEGNDDAKAPLIKPDQTKDKPPESEPLTSQSPKEERQTESESEASQSSSTGRDFEIVDSKEVDRS